MKIAWNRVFLTVVILGMVIWLITILVSGGQKDFLCNRINIVMENNGKLVTCDDVASIIKASRIVEAGKPANADSLKKLRELLCSKSYLTDVEIKNTGGDVVNVMFKQRIPAVILSDIDGNSFYLDNEGYLFPLSKKDLHDVPLVNVKMRLSKKGKMTKDSVFTRKLLDFTDFVSKSSFWNSRIRQIDADRNENLIFTDCSDSVCIRFGQMMEYEEKMNSLQTFYNKINFKEKYKTLDLRFNKRIIAVKQT